MQALPIQILLIAAALVAIILGIRRLRRQELKRGWFALWCLFWLAVAIVAVRPEFSTVVAQSLGIGRGADLITYASLVAIFYLLFRLFVRMERLERNITKIVRHIALQDEDHKK